ALDLPRQARGDVEVEHEGAPFFIDEEVRRINVLVNDAPLMDLPEGVGDIRSDAQRLGQAQVASIEARGEGFAAEIVEHQRDLIALFLEATCVDNAGQIQSLEDAVLVPYPGRGGGPGVLHL